jgi:protein O-mannosyl-transferase
MNSVITGYTSTKNTWQRLFQKALPYLFLGVLVVMAYGNALSAGFVSDDLRAINGNAALGHLSFILLSIPCVLRHIIYNGIFCLFGRAPMYYRLLNILFHFGTVLMCFVLFRMVFNERVALMTASLLALHPIATESVTWISGGVYSTYSFFIILGIWFYYLSVKSKKFYIFSLISFLLSLSSHSVAIIFPLLLFIFVISFYDIQVHRKRLVPFFVIVLLVLTFYFINGNIVNRAAEFQQGHDYLYRFKDLFLEAPVAIVSYLGLIFWPRNLTLYHTDVHFLPAQYCLVLAYFIIFLSVVIFSYRRNKRIFFGLMFFIVSLLPMMTPFGISWIVAERYVYLGSIGIFVVFSVIFDRFFSSGRLKFIGSCVFLLILLVLLARTVVRNMDWASIYTFYPATVRSSPRSHQAHLNLGNAYASQGDLILAAKEYRLAIRFLPEYAEAYYNLAHVEHDMGNRKEEIKNYNIAIKLKPSLRFADPKK